MVTSYTQTNLVKYDEKRYLSQFVSDMFGSLQYDLVNKPHNLSSTALLPWQHTEFQTSPIIRAFHIFSIEAILKHKQVVCMRRKILFTIFKYLFLFQRYSSF